MTDEELLNAARDVRRLAYCRYSGFRVGAALLDENGMLHVGCNVENASYSNVSCAEAGAISAMIAGGGTRIAAIAVAGGRGERTSSCTPCGGCRQRIAEFADENTRIIVKDDDEEWHEFRVDELLPSSFTLDD